MTLEAHREKAIAARKAAGPGETNPILRFRRAKTLRTAIDAKCAECMGCTAEAISSGFRQDISQCSSYGCPLWDFRPYQKGDKETP